MHVIRLKIKCPTDSVCRPTSEVDASSRQVKYLDTSLHCLTSHTSGLRGNKSLHPFVMLLLLSHTRHTSCHSTMCPGPSPVSALLAKTGLLNHYSVCPLKPSETRLHVALLTTRHILRHILRHTFIGTKKQPHKLKCTYHTFIQELEVTHIHTDMQIYVGIKADSFINSTTELK